MSVDTSWDIESYRTAYESDEHWALKRDFMEAHKDRFPETRLICLAQAFVNIELLGCKYPDAVMEQVAVLARDVGSDYKESKKNKLQRTFVKASDAAGAKVKGTSTSSLLGASPYNKSSLSTKQGMLPISSGPTMSPTPPGPPTPMSSMDYGRPAPMTSLLGQPPTTLSARLATLSNPVSFVKAGASNPLSMLGGSSNTMTMSEGSSPTSNSMSSMFGGSSNLMNMSGGSSATSNSMSSMFGKSSKALSMLGGSSNSINMPGRSSNSMNMPSGSSNSMNMPGRSSNSVNMPGGSSNSMNMPGGSSNSMNMPGGSSNSMNMPGGSSNSMNMPGGSSNSMNMPGRSSNSMNMPGGSSNSMNMPGRSSNSMNMPGGSSSSNSMSSMFSGSSKPLSMLGGSSNSMSMPGGSSNSMSSIFGGPSNSMNMLGGSSSSSFMQSIFSGSSKALSMLGGSSASSNSMSSIFGGSSSSMSMLGGSSSTNSMSSVFDASANSLLSMPPDPTTPKTTIITAPPAPKKKKSKADKDKDKPITEKFIKFIGGKSNADVTPVNTNKMANTVPLQKVAGKLGETSGQMFMQPAQPGQSQPSTAAVATPQQTHLSNWCKVVGRDNPLAGFVLVRHENHDNNGAAAAILNTSSCFSRIPINYHYQKVENLFECTVNINGVDVVRVKASGRKKAREQAVVEAVAVLPKHCFTLRIKKSIRAESVTLDQVANDLASRSFSDNPLATSSVANKMMKQMGWTGGGLGKKGEGITEPIRPSEVFGRQGLGHMETNKGAVTPAFRKRVRDIISDYASNSKNVALAFSNEFSKEQRAEIHKIARLCHLKSASRGKDGKNRCLLISRKIPAQDLLLRLLQEGSNDQYELIPPTSTC